MSVSWTIGREIFRRDKGFCAYCGKDLLQDLEAFLCQSIDHFLPVSKGGGKDADNLKLCCRNCQNYKGTKYAEDVVATIALINDGRMQWQKEFESLKDELRGR